MSGGLRIEILADETAVSTLSALKAASVGVMATPGNRAKIEYSLIDWDCFTKPSGFELRILLGWQGDDVVLVWPFRVKNRIAIWNGSGHSFREIIQAESPPNSDWIQTAWECAKSELGADIIRCPRVREDSPMSAILEAEKARVGGDLGSQSVTLRTHEDWNSYYRTLGAKFRRDLRRRKRRLAALGDLRCHLVEDPTEIERALDWTFAQKDIWSKRKNISINLDGNIREFYEAITRQASANGTLMFGVLTLDGNILASAFTIVEGPWAQLLMSTYDRDWKAHSPGHLLLEKLIEWAMEREIDVLDLGIGDEAYKRRFANGYCTVRNYIVPCSGRGRAYLTLYIRPRRFVAGLFGRLPQRMQSWLRTVLPSM